MIRMWTESQFRMILGNWMDQLVVHYHLPYMIFGRTYADSLCAQQYAFMLLHTSVLNVTRRHTRFALACYTICFVPFGNESFSN